MLKKTNDNEKDFETDVQEPTKKKATRKRKARKAPAKKKASAKKQTTKKPRKKAANSGAMAGNVKPASNKKTTKKKAVVKKKPAKSTRKTKKISESELEILGQEKPSQDDLQLCREKTREAAILQYKIEQGKELLKQYERQYSTLVNDEIPELCERLRIENQTTDDGVRLEIKEFIRGKIPTDEKRRKESLAYLRQLKGGVLIKNTMTARFEKGENSKALEVTKVLKKLDIDFDKKQDVHHLSLAKFARELLEDGQAPDLEKLGLYHGKIAKITLPT